jgi:hypothetical protein
MKPQKVIGSYSIKETSGSFSSSVNRLLADGTDLFSPVNEHLLVTIDTIIQAEMPMLPESVAQKGTTTPSMVGSFAALVQWMKARHIHYFSHLSPQNVYRFVTDSAQGLDKVIRGPERIESFLVNLTDKKHLKSLTFSDALRACGISPTLSHKLPGTRRVFIAIKENRRKKAHSTIQHVQVTNGSLWMRARATSLLWDYRKRIPDALTFSPDAGEFARIFRANATPTGSTKTIPIEAAITVVSHAFKWVYEYGPALRNVATQVKKLPKHRDERASQLKLILEKFNEEAESKFWTLRLCGKKGKHLPENYQSYLLATRSLLLAASFVLCAIFTARRMTELLSIKGNSLHGTFDTGFWITTYTGKRSMDSPKPCTRSVAQTITHLVEQMETYNIPLDKSVFSVSRSKGRLRSAISQALNQFTTLIQTEDEDFEWKLASHQFRRIFALIYRWRYDHPDLLALSVYFEHMDLQQIKKYTNDPEWRRIHQEEALRFTASKLQSIALGTIEPKGTFGRSLKKMVERELARVQLTDNNSLAMVMENLAEHRKLELTANRWGCCGAKSALSNLRRAACTTADEVRARANVDPESSTEDKCAGCLFFLTDESRASHWQEKVDSLQRSQASAPAKSMVETRLKQRLHIIERFSRNVFGEREA